MSMPEPQLGYFFPVGGSGAHPGHPLPEPPGGGGIPTPPIYFPPLPGLWPPHKPGEPSLPIALPPGIWPPPSGPGGPVVMPPIFIPDTPEKPIQLPPGTIWPPLPPDSGVNGKVAILVWVLGVGTRWFVYEGPAVSPPVPGPK